MERRSECTWWPGAGRARSSARPPTGTKRSRISTHSSRASDVASLHLKLAPETRGIVTAAHLAVMKPDALLVNTARAGLIERGALEHALAAGRPGRFAIDVFDEEPLTSGPLLESADVLATPHLGYVTWETYESYFSEAFAQVDAFAAGAPVGVLNPEALARAAGEIA